MNAPGKIGAGLAAVLLFGAARLPLEHGLSQERRAAGLRDDAGLDLTFREQVSQASFVAVLGGLRSVVAAIWDLWATDAWEKIDYGQVEKDIRFCQALQPRVFYFWDRGQWMMAINAAGHVRNRDPERSLLSEALYDSYVEKGLAMTKQAQRWLPDTHQAWWAEYNIYYKRVRPMPWEAMSRALDHAVECTGAPSYLLRMRAYALARTPSRQAEARAELDRLYQESPRHHKPTLLALRRAFQLADEIQASPPDAEKDRRLLGEAKAVYAKHVMYHTPALVAAIHTLELRLDVPRAEWIPESRGEVVEEPL